MFYTDTKIFGLLNKIKEIKDNGEKAYIVNDEDWVDVMDKEELKEFAIEELNCIEECEDKETFEYLNSLDIEEESTMIEILEARFFEIMSF